MSEEWCYEKLESLKVKCNRSNTIEELYTCLKNSPGLLEKVAGRFLCSPEIYECLKTQTINDDLDIEPIDTATEILFMCMEKLSLRQDDFSQMFRRTFLHKNSRIRLYALNVILNKIPNQFNVDYLSDTISDELLHHILVIALYGDIELSSLALQILCRVLPNHLEKSFFKEDVLQALKENAITSSRVYAFAADMVMKSSVSVEKLEYIFDHALSELDNDDPLQAVTILQLIGHTVRENTFFHYLEKRHFLDIICKRLEEFSNTSNNSILIPAIIVCFAKMFNVQPQKIMDGYPMIVRWIFHYIASVNDCILAGALQGLVIMTETEMGVVLLEERYPGNMKDVFSMYSGYLSELPTQTKILAFMSLEHIFKFENAVQPNTSSILQRWFKYLCRDSNNMDYLKSFCVCPFPDIKLAALKLIAAICLYPWGIEAVKNTAGFLEFFLDRGTEFNMDAKYEKFCIIKKLAESDIFNIPIHGRLITYLNQGPYFVQPQMSVAMESV